MILLLIKLRGAPGPVNGEEGPNEGPAGGPPAQGTAWYPALRERVRETPVAARRGEGGPR